MADPQKPEIDYSYTGFQQEQQENPFPGTNIDADLAELKRGIDDTIDALKDVRRSDGKLRNGIVTADSLGPDVVAVGEGMNPSTYDPDSVAGNVFDRANHTGEMSADALTDGSTNRVFLTSEKNKLAGIDAGATANSTDATLLARGNHTGTQAISTVSGLQTALDAKAADNAVVKLTGNQTVAGTKTFSDAPTVPDASFSIAKTSGLQTALDAKAADNAVVKLTGNQTVAGTKTFSSAPTVPDASFSIAKTSGLQTALDAKVPTSRTVSAGGLATGGGALSANRTITVTAASEAEAKAGTASTVAMTPQRTSQAIQALVGRPLEGPVSSSEGDADWDSHTVRGQYQERLLHGSNDANGPGVGEFFHVWGVGYGLAETQWALPYRASSGLGKAPYYRTNYPGDGWSDWQRVITEDGLKDTLQVLTPIMFGAAGNGTLGADSGTDDASALQNAIDALPAGGVLDGLGKTYRCTSGLTLKANITLRNMKIDFSGAGNTAKLFNVAGSLGSSCAATEMASVGEIQIGFTGTAAAGWAAGDHIWIDSTELWDTDDNCVFGEMHVASAVFTNGANFYDPILYAMGRTGLAAAKVNWVDNITLDGVHAVGSAAGSSGQQYGADFRYVRNLRVVNCTFTHFDDRCFWVWRCWAPVFIGNYIGHANRTGLSYGIQFAAGTYHAKVIGNTFVDCRHGVDFGDNDGPCRYAVVQGNTFALMREQGMSTHTAADYVTIDGNIFQCDPNLSLCGAMLLRGANVKVTNNQIVNPGGSGIIVRMTPDTGLPYSVDVSGNTITGMVGSQSQGIDILKYVDGGDIGRISVVNNYVEGSGESLQRGVDITDNIGVETSFVTVANNTFESVDRGVLVYAQHASAIIGMVTIIGNQHHMSAGSTLQSIYVLASTDGYINDVVIQGNQMSGGPASGVFGIRCSNEENLIVTGNNMRAAPAGDAIVTSATNAVIDNNLT